MSESKKVIVAKTGSESKKVIVAKTGSVSAKQILELDSMGYYVLLVDDIYAVTTEPDLRLAGSDWAELIMDVVNDPSTGLEEMQRSMLLASFGEALLTRMEANS